MYVLTLRNIKIFNIWVVKTNHLYQITASHAADFGKLLNLSVLSFTGKMKITTVLTLQGWGLQKIKVFITMPGIQ